MRDRNFVSPTPHGVVTEAINSHFSKLAKLMTRGMQLLSFGTFKGTPILRRTTPLEGSGMGSHRLDGVRSVQQRRCGRMCITQPESFISCCSVMGSPGFIPVRNSLRNFADGAVNLSHE